MPSLANIFAVSLLPMPIEPVSPTRSGRSAMQRLLEMRAQLRCHLRRRSEEGGKRRNGLMHQHAQSIDRLVPPGPGILEKAGLKGIVDDVADRGGHGKALKRDIQRSFARHARTG